MRKLLPLALCVFVLALALPAASLVAEQATDAQQELKGETTDDCPHAKKQSSDSKDKWKKKKWKKKKWNRKGHHKFSPLRRYMKMSPAQKIATPIGAALGIALLIALASGMLILLKAATPKYVDRCAKQITAHFTRSLIAGIVLVGIPVAVGLLACDSCGGKGKCDPSGFCIGLVVVLVVLALWRLFAAAALSLVIGERALALKGKKSTDGVKNIIVGTTILGLACAIPVAGWTALAVISVMEVGAAVMATKM